LDNFVIELNIVTFFYIYHQMKNLILLLLTLALAAYAQQERVAIIQTLDNKDSIDFQNLLYLTDKLRETAVNVLPKERYGVMTTESIIAFLGSQERAVKACNESSCLAELGRMVSADYVAQGRIGRFGKDLTIKVELYNVKTGNLIGSFTGDSKNIYGLRDIIDGKAPDLFKQMLSTSNVAVMPQQGQQDVNMEQRAKVQRLIDNGLAKNKDEIQKESLYLSYIDKSNLYADNRMNAVGYLVLNFVPGLGLGSYIQGEIISGVILSIADVVGGSTLAYVCIKDDYGGDIGLLKAAVIPSIILASSRIVGLILAYNYTNKYNKLLDEALNNNNNISYSIEPLIIPRNGVPAVGLGFSLRY